MNSLKSKLFAIATIVAGAIFVVALPYLQRLRYRDTQVASVDPAELTAAAKEHEERIQSLIANDESQIDRSVGIRYIERVPDSPLKIEAAFRQRKRDACELVPAQQPIEFRQFALSLTTRDRRLKTRNEYPSMRSPVMSIGLKMLDLDQRELPSLAKSSIVDFVDEHFVSLQARVLKDNVSGELFLHHRPIAALGKYRTPTMSDVFVEPINSTVAEIRGLGVMYHIFNDGVVQTTANRKRIDQSSNLETGSTAVSVFGFDWLEAGQSRPSRRYELIFIHARKASSLAAPFDFHTFVTTHNRSRLHYVSRSRTSLFPQRPSTATVLGTTKITAFEKDGLHPKRSATRQVSVNRARTFASEKLSKFVADRFDTDNWLTHTPTVLDAIIRSEIESSDFATEIER